MIGGTRQRGLFGLTASLMRGRNGRLAATFVAVVAGVGFAAASIVLTASLQASAEDAVAAQARAADVVLNPAQGQDGGAELVAAIARVDGVAAVEPIREDYLDVELSGTTSLSRIRSLPATPSLRGAALTAGRWPAVAGEVVVAASDADGPAPGARLVTHPIDRPPVTVTVVGLVNTEGGIGDDVTTLFAADRDVQDWTAAAADAIYVQGSPGAGRTALRDAVAAVAPGATVRTGDEQASRELESFTGGSDVLSTGLQAASGVGLVVSALVVANTYQVVVAQRAREYALLRCIGARRRQLGGIVVREAALVGFTGSALGTLVGGSGGAAITAVLARSGTALPLTRTEIPIGSLTVAGLVGLGTTVLAVLAAAWAAARRRPLEALREVAVADTEPRARATRCAAGSVLTGVGGAGLLVGATAASMAVVLVAGVLLSAGALLLVRPMMGGVLRVLRAPLGACGAPARLAWANLVRNPRRAAAASTALLVGITLVATVLVGVASTRATLAQEIESRYPVDAEVLALRDALPPRLTADLSRVPGVDELTVISGTTVRIGDVPRPVLGVGEEARRTGRAGLSTPAPGELLLPAAVARNGRIADGDRIRLSATGGTIELRARIGTADLGAPMTTPADLGRLDPAAGPRAIWLRTVPAADTARITEDIRSATSASGSDAILNGAVRLRAAYQGALDTATLVALGLLAMSVAIAAVGIGNTLTLSVLERRRESALLRALGLTRARLRLSLMWEAVVIGLAAALGGIGLGCALGVAGSYALLEFGAATVPQLPVLQLVGVAVVGTGLAALASTVPAGLALRSTSAQALAAD